MVSIEVTYTDRCVGYDYAGSGEGEYVWYVISHSQIVPVVRGCEMEGRGKGRE